MTQPSESVEILIEAYRQALNHSQQTSTPELKLAYATITLNKLNRDMAAIHTFRKEVEKLHSELDNEVHKDSVTHTPST